MYRKIFALVLVFGLVVSAGCATRAIATGEAILAEAVQPDGIISSFIWFGPNSAEFDDSVDHFDSHRRTYENDLRSIHDLWDKHFLRYDKYDPFAE